MPLSIYELVKSGGFRTGEREGSSTLYYMLYGEDNETNVESLVRSTAPSTHRGRPIVTIGVEHIARLVWQAEVEYGVPSKVDSPSEGMTGDEDFGGYAPGDEVAPEDGGGADPSGPPEEGEPPDLTGASEAGPEWQFDFGSENVHITRSIATVAAYSRGVSGPDADAPATFNLIGVSRDKVEGCDIFQGSPKFSLTYTFPSVRISYMRNLAAYVGKSNAYDWKGFEAYELVFLGVSGGSKSGEGVTLTFNFAFGEVREDILIDTGFTVDRKNPWDYLWVAYYDALEDNQLIQKPKHAYVEQVYRYMSFRKLGIGK